MKCLLAILCGGLMVALALFTSAKPQDEPKLATPLPTAIGAIHPRISPDGSTIAFSYQGAIWTTPRAGGTMTRLTDGPNLDIEPAWSPDGKRIAFVRSPNMNGGDLHLIDAASGKAVSLP